MAIFTMKNKWHWAENLPTIRPFWRKEWHSNSNNSPQNSHENNCECAHFVNEELKCRFIGKNENEKADFLVLLIDDFRSYRLITEK